MKKKTEEKKMQESPVKGLIQTNMLLGGQVGNKNVRVPGNEQSPHYLNMAKTYIEENPGTPVGSPGRYQVRSERY